MRKHIKRDISDQIIRKAKEFGASSAGIASVEALKESPSLLNPFSQFKFFLPFTDFVSVRPEHKIRGKTTMRKNRFFYRTVLSTLAVIVFIGVGMSRGVLAYDFYGWEHGASGYEYAMTQATDAEKPLILYFNTDWCKWCKRLNTEYLSSYEIEKFLSDIPKVEINPDKGAAELALSRKYGVRGFPSFLVLIPALSNKTEKIHPFRTTGSWTADEFLLAVREKIAGQYNNKGYSRTRSRRYEEAIRYYEIALDFDPENAYAYYGMGISYHSIAYTQRDPEKLGIAEENFLRALEIDPNHKASRKELKRLRLAMKKMGIR